MRIATWNVNSLRARLGHVLDWLRANPVDVLGLQELKLMDEQFPHADFEPLGYRAAVSGQKSYNGVAILSRHDLLEVRCDMAGYADPAKRVISATVGGVRIVNVYVPNGQAVGSEKYSYKLAWYAALREHLRSEIAGHPLLAVTGDFNVAPADADVHDPAAWAGQIMCSEAERAAFGELLGLGLRDTFRLFAQPARSFTWWDYRMGAFRRNLGLRIDHILASAALADKCQSSHVDTEPRRRERPSDHAPVVTEFAD